MVFEPGAAPDDRLAFVAWFSQVVRLRDGHLLPDPTTASPALQRWYEGMTYAFPPTGSTHAGKVEMQEDELAADYRFAPSAVFARFELRVSRKAYPLAMKLARMNRLGFFDASGESATCYTVVNGRFIVAHRGETIPA
jgi:hypothetical protein